LGIASDADGVGLREDRGKILAGDGVVRQRRNFAEARRAERGAPRPPDGKPGIFGDIPIEGDLRVAGAADIAVLVVAL